MNSPWHQVKWKESCGIDFSEIGTILLSKDHGVIAC